MSFCVAWSNNPVIIHQILVNIGNICMILPYSFVNPHIDKIAPLSLFNFSLYKNYVTCYTPSSVYGGSIKDMCYTVEQKDLIAALIGTNILVRRLSSPLRDSFSRVYRNLENDNLLPEDLKLIASALELITPNSCQSCNKEGYRDMIEALTATQMMLTQFAQCPAE